MDETTPTNGLPGFRFKPTEEELLSFYLRNLVNGKKMDLDIIGLLNIYQHDPWDLPGLAKIGEREWYFFVPRDRKHSNGGRPNRTTEHGFWKATGSDRKIVSLSEPKRVIGLRKTLVFYKGRAPKGCKTDWVMNEYRLPDGHVVHKDIVLCKIYRKATSLKELEQRAAKEEAAEKLTMAASSYPTSPLSSSSNNGAAPFSSGVAQMEDLFLPTNICHNHDYIVTLKEEVVDEKLDSIVAQTNCKLVASPNTSTSIKLPFGQEGLGDLEVPKLSMDWAQDPFCSQCCSPWLENLLNNFSSPTLFSQFLST